MLARRTGLVEVLRACSDEDLAQLLTARADLLHPLPPDLATLAGRSGEPWSVRLALESVDRWALDLARALTGADQPVRRSALAERFRVPEEVVAAGIARLRALALVVSDGELVRPVGGLRQVLGDTEPVAAPQPHPTPLRAEPVDPGIVAASAAAAAELAVRQVGELLDGWAGDPPAVLRAGGLGVRELRRATRMLEVAEPVAAVLISAAHGAGLLGSSRDPHPVWLPTEAYDDWLAAPVPLRWARLAAGWLGSDEAAGLAGRRDERDRPLTLLSGDLNSSAVRQARLATLEALADAGGPVEADAVVRVVGWRRPLLATELRDELVILALAEAEVLGMTGRGGLGPGGLALLTADVDAAAAAIAPDLPVPADGIVLQADLTAVAPGPLTRQLTEELGLLADVESRGGATVYRFSEASVRRALDAGRSVEDIHTFLAHRSRTPVPQPLRYLVDDVARRHGRIRVGAARCYLRCADEGLLAELLAHRRTAGLALHRVAPTVLVAQSPPTAVLTTLRAAGFLPAEEDPAGALVISRAPARRAPRRPSGRRTGRSAPRPDVVAAAVVALRAGDRRARAAGSGPRVAGPGTLLSLLRVAAANGDPVLLGYLDPRGVPSQRVVEPIAVGGGVLTAYDRSHAEVRRFTLHRVTGATLTDPDGGG